VLEQFPVAFTKPFSGRGRPPCLPSARATTGGISVNLREEKHYKWYPSVNSAIISPSPLAGEGRDGGIGR